MRKLLECRTRLGGVFIDEYDICSGHHLGQTLEWFDLVEKNVGGGNQKIYIWFAIRNVRTVHTCTAQTLMNLM